MFHNPRRWWLKTLKETKPRSKTNNIFCSYNYHNRTSIVIASLYSTTLISSSNTCLNYFSKLSCSKRRLVLLSTTNQLQSVSKSLLIKNKLAITRKYSITTKSVPVTVINQTNNTHFNKSIMTQRKTKQNPTKSSISIPSSSSSSEIISIGELDYAFSKNSTHVDITISSSLLSSRTTEFSNNDNKNKNTTTPSSSSTIPNVKQAQEQQQQQQQNNPNNEVPDSVLQYERQKRKVQAKDQSTNVILDINKHLRILYEDHDIIVVDKPSGILCVPGLNDKPNLLDLVQDHCFNNNNNNAKTNESTNDATTAATTTTTNNENNLENNERMLLPRTDKSKWIVHRLDMATSGIVIFAKTEQALKPLHAAFRDRIADKEYHALVCGHIHVSSLSNNLSSTISSSNNNNDNNNNKNTIQESDSKQIHDHDKVLVQSGTIQLPLQRDHKHPPFMRIATPSSELEAQQVVEQLQQHGYKKLIKKRPKPSHTEFHILNHEYYSSKTTNTTNSNIDAKIDATNTTTTTTNTKKDDDGNDDHIESLSLPMTRIKLIPHTGRTHQLRVHCAAIGHPIVGDPSYGLCGEANRHGGLILFPSQTKNAMNNSKCRNSSSTDNDDHQQQPYFYQYYHHSASLQDELQFLKYYPPNDNPMCLHAAKLSLPHPITNEMMTFVAPPPF